MTVNPAFMWQSQENHEPQASLGNIIRALNETEKCICNPEFVWEVWGYFYLQQTTPSPNYKLWCSYLSKSMESRPTQGRKLKADFPRNVICVLAPLKFPRESKAQNSPLHRKSVLFSLFREDSSREFWGSKGSSSLIGHLCGHLKMNSVDFNNLPEWSCSELSSLPFPSAFLSWSVYSVRLVL